METFVVNDGVIINRSFIITVIVVVITMMTSSV